jgi:3-hydroxymyristoyl/3-hydroxydecanoyl-(acyl carrier protein) dehydratase
MDPYFRAYSFVDRITGIEPGVGIRGRYIVPSAVRTFPGSLVAEAVGQLAAWAAMSAVDFSHRPVAGIAGGIELLAGIRPGQALDLAAELESVDTETVAYHGSASSDGTPILRLRDCVGPMVPTEDFDDPKSLRERFTLLSTIGAAPGAFRGVPELVLERREGERGHCARAMLQVPAAAPFFADHFPRRPVFPGTLLMHANLQTAATLAAEVPVGLGGRWVPGIITDVKLRTFIPPGESLGLTATRTGRSDTSLRVAVESRIGHRLISSAEIQFSWEAHL